MLTETYHYVCSMEEDSSGKHLFSPSSIATGHQNQGSEDEVVYGFADEIEDCGDEVTYLKDAWKEPSFNTFQRTLEHPLTNSTSENQKRKSSPTLSPSTLCGFADDVPRSSYTENYTPEPSTTLSPSTLCGFANDDPRAAAENNTLEPLAPLSPSTLVNFDYDTPEMHLLMSATTCTAQPSTACEASASTNSLRSLSISSPASLLSLSLAALTPRFSPAAMSLTNPILRESTNNNENFYPTNSLSLLSDETLIEPEPSFNLLEMDRDFWDFSPSDDSDYQPEDIQNFSDTSCDSAILAENQTVRKRKRAKRGQADVENWQSEVNKSKRMKGENYKGRRKAEDGKIVFDVERRQRHLKPRCEHNGQTKYFECHKITETERQHIFKKYWQLSWEGKRTWVQQTVLQKDIARRSCSGNNDRRQHTFKYNLNVNGNNLKVCKKMYLGTLDIGEWSAHNWAKVAERNVPEECPTPKRNVNVKAIEEIARNNVKEFLQILPKLESHYCRKSTSKLYLEPIWQSKQKLYREYIQYMTDAGKSELKVSLKLFLAEFESMNLALFSPKKDQCDFCCAYNVGNVLEADYREHVEKKDSARAEKSRDKALTDTATKVFTFDLQAVLLSPALKASALYYKTKLKVHNYTIFDNQTKEAFCFIWHESEGGVNADEFASILHYFIKKHVSETVRHIIFWSDGCTNQNRNAILANALLMVAKQRSITITHKYLEKGHTQMECDSMHSTIERQLKNRDIYSPAQYVDVCRNARLTKPYIVEYLQHTFFSKFSTMPYLNSIRPGKKAGDDTVFDLRCIEYRSDGTIWFKKQFTDEFQQLSKKIKMPRDCDTMPPLYDSRIAIPKSKYVHLQELKTVLPADVHSFYDQLPHLCTEQRRNANNCSCKKAT